MHELISQLRQEKDRQQQESFLSAKAISLNFSPEDPAHLYLARIGHLEILPEAEEQELALLTAQGDKDARERLLEHNYLRVAGITREYLHRGLCSLDLLQEGNEALEKAVAGYKPGSSYPFSAYASWRIRKAMVNALKNYTCTTRISPDSSRSPSPLDPDLLRNPAALRWIVEQKMRRPMSEEDWIILAARFFPWGHPPLTLDQAGAMMGIPRNQIREAEFRTIRKNSPAARSKKIRDFYT